MAQEILIYKTNIQTSIQINYVSYLFSKINEIMTWNVDLEDVDNVLRIVVIQESINHEIIERLNSIGILCEELPD